jgi:DNA invertase Pin-like site-specific DNA recombinase
MTTTPNKKAICYYRVSSQHQQEKQSISMQKTRLHKFAREKCYKIVAEYQDDGISGEDIDRMPGFQEVLETIQNDSVDVLIVYMVDRIGRFKKRRDRHYITQLLEDNEVSVDSPYHGLYDCKSEEDLNKLEADLVESRRDNKMRGIRISEGHMEVRRRGGFSGGQMPYGYKYDKKKKNSPSMILDMRPSRP